VPGNQGRGNANEVGLCRLKTSLPRGWLCVLVAANLFACSASSDSTSQDTIEARAARRAQLVVGGFVCYNWRSSITLPGGCMAAKVDTKQYKHVDLIQVAGRIDSSTAPLLEQALKKVMKDGRYHIVVDLAETEFMSSAGLRALISALKETRRFNRGDLRLASMPSKINKAFELAGFLELFKVYENSTDAVGSF